jgi:ubiquinone/menaquinone biosynthesis C-methylase UbiE
MNDDQREFWSSVAQKYDRVADLQIGGRTRLLLRERLEKEQPLGNLVEFGCGTGFFTSVLARKAATVIATDLSPAMLALARERVRAENVTFQPQDCQRTSFSDGSFDTAFLGLVIHFTEPRVTLREMHRIVRVGGTIIIVNVDVQALAGLDRLRAFARMLFHGVIGYQTRPPKRFGRNMLTERELCELLRETGFEVVGSEAVKDASRSSNIPVEYVRARRT